MWLLGARDACTYTTVPARTHVARLLRAARTDLECTCRACAPRRHCPRVLGELSRGRCMIDLGASMSRARPISTPHALVFAAFRGPRAHAVLAAHRIGVRSGACKALLRFFQILAQVRFGRHFPCSGGPHGLLAARPVPTFRWPARVSSSLRPISTV